MPKRGCFLFLLLTGLAMGVLWGPQEIKAAPTRIVPEGKDLLPAEKVTGRGVWVDPAVGDGKARVTVWFDEQFLGDGKAYNRRAKEFAKWPRRKLRDAVMGTLQALSQRSFREAEKQLKKLQSDGQVSNLQRHWIVNGFTCTVTAEGLKDLQRVPGVKKIFRARAGVRVAGKAPDAEFFPKARKPALPFSACKHPWYVRYLLADRVWKDFKVTGKGTLNVIHDFNFLSADHLTPNLYRNPKEVPGNGKDDDSNGLIDDYHGFNFVTGTPQLTLRPVDLRAVNPRLMHGSQCAGIVCGVGIKGKPHALGLAPAGSWAGVIGGNQIEAAVEWSIAHHADTYSMSFSIPRLGEYRSHWRKVMEQGSFCGVCFVSGAGNFARSAKVPVQMRVPEDIPNAVFAAAGVQRNLGRTVFSSKGPVQWKTEHYSDGLVPKPEVCAFNSGLPLQRRDGTVIPVAASGNSFAGPMLCGSLALMLSADPDLLPWDARAILMATATDVAAKGRDDETGHGLINCYRAVKEVLRRKAAREGKDGKRFTGRQKGDELDTKGLARKLRSVLRVARVQPGSQAARLGVKAGDIIQSYNGVLITNQQSLLRAKKKADEGKIKRIPVVIDRAGKELKLTFDAGQLGIFPRFEFREPVFQ